MIESLFSDKTRPNVVTENRMKRKRRGREGVDSEKRGEFLIDYWYDWGIDKYSVYIIYLRLSNMCLIFALALHWAVLWCALCSIYSHPAINGKAYMDRKYFSSTKTYSQNFCFWFIRLVLTQNKYNNSQKILLLV